MASIIVLVVGVAVVNELAVKQVLVVGSDKSAINNEL